jgi:hypothetical protein
LLGELNQLLWRQRSLITELLYRLDVQQLLLAGGRTRWMAVSVEEVESAFDRIRRHEEIREHLMAELPAALGLGSDASLLQLGEVAPDPWGTIFAEHQVALLGLIAEVEDLTIDNRDLLHRGMADMRRLVDQMSGPIPSQPSYGRDGTAPSGRGGPLLVDREV